MKQIQFLFGFIVTFFMLASVIDLPRKEIGVNQAYF